MNAPLEQSLRAKSILSTPTHVLSAALALMCAHRVRSVFRNKDKINIAYKAVAEFFGNRFIVKGVFLGLT